MVILVASGVFGLRWWTVGRFVQSTNDAFLQADQVTVSPKISGYVDQVLVSDNEAVRVGQPLVRIDAKDLEAKSQQASAQIEQGQAAMAQAKAQILQQQAQISQAKAQWAAAKASSDFAALQVARYAPLAQTGAESGEKLDQLRQTRDQTSAQTAAAAATTLSAERQIGMLSAQIETAKAQIAQAQAQAAQAQSNADGSTIRATIAGRVGDRTVRAGQYVQPGTGLMTLVPVQALYLVANFKETQIGRMRPGQAVDIKVDALSDQKIHGVVESFSPGTGAQFALIPPSNATGNFTKIVQRVPVRIRIEAPASVRPVLLAGLSAAVSVDTRNQPSNAPSQVAAR